MRAFFVLAVLAVSCPARSHKRTDWEHLKSRMSEGAVPTSDDVELMLDTIEDVPAARGEVLKVMTGYMHGKKDADGHVLSSYTNPTLPLADDPLISRLHEAETFESLLDMAMSERNRCEREACDVVFLDLTVNLFSTMVTGMYTVRHEGHPDLNSLIKTSRADDIITLTQDAADRLRGTAQHNFMDMQAHLIRSLLTGDYEGLEDKLFRHLPMMAEEAERALARLDDTEDKGRRLGLAEESESDATKAFHAMRDDYALSTPAGGLSDNPAIDPKGTLGYGSKFHTACTGLTSPAEAIEAVRVALDSGVDVNSKNRDYTCLHIAVFHAIPALVDFLLAAGADVDAVAHGHTPLHFAAYAAPEESMLVLHQGPKLRNSRKKWASELDRAYANITRQLVAAGADVDAPFVHQDITVRPIHMASSRGFAEIVAELIASGSDVNAVDELGVSPLNSAQAPGEVPTRVHTDVVKVLLAAGAEPNAADPSGWTLLHVASYVGNLEVVDALLRAGARVDKGRHNGATALYDAAQKGHDRVVDPLIEAGAETSIGVEEVINGESVIHSPLLSAAIGGHTRLVRSLIRGGVDVNQAGYGGATALFAAARQGHRDTVNLLLESGARTDVRASRGLGLSEYGLMDLPMDKSTRAFLEDHFRSTRNRALLKLVLAAVLVVAVVAIGVWKSRAPAHERAARELLDDLAPSARTRRGRAPADAASVPAWVTAFHVANLGLVIYSNMETGLKFRSGDLGLGYFLIFCYWTGIRTSIDWIAPGNPVWGHVGADAFILFACFQRSWKADDIDISVKGFLFYFPLLGACVNTYEAIGWLKRFVYGSAPDAERAARELLDAETEREATTRARASQRGARPGLRKRANRGRRREAAPRAPEPDPPEIKSETAAPEPKAPEPEPEPASTRAEQQASPRAAEETVLEPTAPESKVTEPEPEPVPVAEPRAPSTAPVPESKVEEPVVAPTAALESKSEAPAEGFEIVARVLEHLNEPHLLPIFEAEEINDDVLPTLYPSDLIDLGVSQMTCLTILGAAHSAAKNKKLETEDVLDNVAKHQSVLEEALREHREEIKRLRIRELPEDLCCPITCEIMKDPVLCVEDGHTYERVAVEQWFATGARTSPATSAQLESTALAPNHMARKLIAALLEEHGGERRRDE